MHAINMHVHNYTHIHDVHTCTCTYTHVHVHTYMYMQMYLGCLRILSLALTTLLAATGLLWDGLNNEEMGVKDEENRAKVK